MYNNLNCEFIFNNIWSLLTKFWISEVITKKGSSKIWLTIIINHTSNKSFTLINNLPFRVKGYTNVLAVIKQVLNTSVFCEKNKLKTIYFIYHFDAFQNKNKYKQDLNITNMFIYLSLALLMLILVFFTFILFLEVYQTYNISIIDENVLYCAHENIKDYKEFNEVSTKRFIFSSFIELFKENSCSFPSKFVDINENDLNELKSLLNNQNVIADNSVSFHKTMLKNNDRLKEYESIVYDLVEIIMQQNQKMREIGLFLT